MIVIKLREAIRSYEERAGEAMTYAELADRTGLSRATIEAMGSRPRYNTTLETIDKICTALGCTITELMEHVPEKRGPRKRRG